ncbi:hypothetical protein CcCBS67573_g01999 [Chytriomyces confervae]|uniref:PH domain-containing protein n=1 Tax=Chytriomyces confervae TaxID=246404 RepID=A0A507FKH7_9FUNG|nr:hypothetical protein CcCBS67573_g01999 [Chytriomyces confervae]
MHQSPTSPGSGHADLLDDGFQSSTLDLLQIPLGYLQSSSAIAHESPALRLHNPSGGTGPSWKSRYFALSRSGTLFQYRGHPSTQSTPLASLGVTAYSGFYNASSDSWLLQMDGMCLQTRANERWLIKLADRSVQVSWLAALSKTMSSDTDKFGRFQQQQHHNMNAAYYMGGDFNNSGSSTASSTGESVSMSMLVASNTVVAVARSKSVGAGSNRQHQQPPYSPPLSPLSDVGHRKSESSALPPVVDLKRTASQSAPQRKKSFFFGWGKR